MSRASITGFLLFSCLLISVSSTIDNEFNCNCDDEGSWSIHTILECQRVSDFLIAVAYFSIPIELLYFVSCSNFPFKWVLLQFIAFIVLCGLTHLLNGWTYYGPHSFQLMLSLTIAKFMTALVSCATAIALLTLIPLLLKVKVREIFLRQNVLELDQEVGMMKKQKEASWHVRMLTQEIRKSLDKHTILYTTLVELSKTLDLHNCAVWMPNDDRTEMNLTHELKASSNNYGRSILSMIRMPDSALGTASGGRTEEAGALAAIRMPMLRVSNFKGALLNYEQNRALQQARKSAMMASQARNSFQKVMSHGMRRPMHSILGLLSMFQNENMTFEQKMIVDTLVKTSNVLSTLINDVMEISAKDNGRFPLEMRPFQLHSMIREASCFAKCLCVYQGFGFETEVQSSLPDLVIGDERRAFQVILHMVGHLLNMYDGGKTFIFRVFSESGSQGKNDRMLGMWKANAPHEYISVKFEIEISEGRSLSDGSISATHSLCRRHNSDEVEGLSFGMCKKLVKMMLGNIWISPSSLGQAQGMTLVLKFQVRPSYVEGLKVVLADDDDVNRIVTKKLLEKLGCEVTAVSSGFECLSSLSSAGNSFRVVILDLQMPEMDGFEVAVRIRKFCSRNWPLIIALTASAEDHLCERCLQIGMNGLIRKPVLLQGMGDELRRVMQRAGEGL
ncbi:hypothetical protein K2173_012741 [Erythroxylum novogranatense]|uniref:Response regulatory domain-containing protein n=1 Tax=Erythroxylum novogranatense TaxID=1862640 RepID=A0AAV8TTI7_9ROSI|nr:hypothetical protein K2173_012741 [Erythroxylum novogranatense]